MVRFQRAAAGILVSGVFGFCACGRDVASTTTTTSAVITPASAAVRARAASSSRERQERELMGPDRAATTGTPMAARATAVDASATAAGTRTAPREGAPVTAPSPVGPGGFAAAPLNPAGGFVQGSLEPAPGFGPARVDPRRGFTPAPLDTSFSGPNVVDDGRSH